MQILLGVDDTDVLGHRPGTGRLARELAVALEAEGLARMVAVVRQQLLVDPRIPYTSHNSPACLVLEVPDSTNGKARQLFDAACRYVAERAADGSDPGVCVAAFEQVDADIVDFGCQASTTVVTKSAALELAARRNLLLAELGGTGGGVIGALAGVGLTADGNAGRYLELAAGIRDIDMRVAARELQRRGVTLISAARDGHMIPPDTLIQTDGKIRPRRINGWPVLLVEPSADGWQCFDRKQHHDHEGME